MTAVGEATVSAASATADAVKLAVKDSLGPDEEIHVVLPDEDLEVFKKARDQVRRNSAVNTKGVHQAKPSGNWLAQITVKGKTRHIGTFPSSEEASCAHALVEKALDDSGLSRQDDEILEVFKKARDHARASFSLKNWKLPWYW